MIEELPINIAKIEDLLSQVRGVLAVRAVPNAQGQLDELHVVGSPDRSAKQMVRDIESLLYVRGGVRVDHRKISLVQISDTVIHPEAVRVQLHSISQSAADEPLALTVTLAIGDQLIQGIGQQRPEQDPQDPHSQIVLAGYATIHALDQLIGARGQFRLDNLQRQSFGAIEVNLAHLSLITDDSIDMLLGISLVRDDMLGSAVRAILDAVNRRLQRLLTEHTVVRPNSRP